MIATHTFNPSVDITYVIDLLEVGNVNRVKDSIKNPGGKGINVTKVLHTLGVDYCAYGYLGGRHGEWIDDELKKNNIKSVFTFIEGETRQSLAINDGNSQTEILEKGPIISKHEQEKYIENATANIKKSIVTTISGSSPNLENNSKIKHMEQVLDLYRGSYIIVDTNAEELKNLLKNNSAINCIKPNKSEFEVMIGKSDMTIDDLIISLKSHQLFEGIDVFLTLGSNGAIIKWENELYRATIPQKQITNPVGSGDSTVAGIAFGVHNQLAAESIIKLALACGTSNALQEQTGHIDINQVETIKKEVEVERL